MEQFDYTVQSSKGFDETVAAVEAKSREKGFNVLVVHDVKATLESKGFSREPMKIVEICNAKYVDQVLAKDIKIALMLPCPVVVYVAGRQDLHQHPSAESYRRFLSSRRCCSDRRRSR